MRQYLLLISILVLGCQASGVQEAPAVANGATVAAPAAVAPKNTNDPDKIHVMGKFDPADDPDFVVVGKPYTAKSGMMLRKETFDAFKKMFEAAKKDGVTLTIISSTRNFDQQKAIWEGKWKRFAAETPDSQKRALRILEYSSMPGTSRHHWGTDVDLNDLNNATFEGNGKYKKVYEWLVKNAATYGFGQPYTTKGVERPEGYNEEKWHWSYLPIAKPFRETYLRTVVNEDISGFEGSSTAVMLDVVKNYVGGVSAACR